MAGPRRDEDEWNADGLGEIALGAFRDAAVAAGNLATALGALHGPLTAITDAMRGDAEKKQKQERIERSFDFDE